MMRRNDISLFLAISVVLHALLLSYLMQWTRANALAKPPDVIKVRIIQGVPQVKPLPVPARPVRGRPPIAIPHPLSAKPLPREEKSPAPEQDTPAPPASAVPAASGSDAPTTLGSPDGVPASNAAANDGVNADRAFANARDAYIMELYAIIKKHYTYPPLARRRGQEGRVQLRFVIGEAGRAQDIEVVASSGFNLLDRAAVETIRSIPLPPPPRRGMQIPITIVYRLEDET